MTNSTTSPDMATIRSRIREAMALRGMQQTTLGREAGLSKSAMSRLLNGQRDISAGELGLLAQVLGQPVGWFVDEPESSTFTHANRPAAQARPMALAARLAVVPDVGSAPDTGLEDAKSRARDLLEVDAELDRTVVAAPRVVLPTPPRPATSHMKTAGKQMAQRVREACGLTDEPIEDFTTFAWEHFGLRIAREPLATGITGLLVTDLPAEAAHPRQAPPASPDATVTSLALINTAGTRLGRQRYTAAHELGHLLFADADLYFADYRGADDNRDEWRANEFAAVLLMPEAGVAKLARELEAGVENGGTAAQRAQWAKHLVGAVAAHFGTSVDSACIRCEVLGHITEQEKTRLRNASATQLLRDTGHGDYADADELAQDVVEPPAALTAKALYAYTEGLIGLGTLARVWNTEDVHALGAELADAGWSPSFD